MAQCKRCSGKASLFKQFCDTCEALNRADEQQRQVDAEAHKLESERLRVEAREQAINKAAKERLDEIQASVSLGQHVYMYQSVYVPVDSVVLGERVAPEFDISPLRDLGLAGWEVVGTVPKTIGVALENRVSEVFGAVSYGGGIGGNVVGVHLLLRKAVDPNSAQSRPHLIRYISGLARAEARI
jgi:hypothetical protein